MNLVKKMAYNVDNVPNYSEKRYKTICQIQKLLKEGCSYREIARRMGGWEKYNSKIQGR